MMRIIPDLGQQTRGVVKFEGQSYACAIGKGGIIPEAVKQEGDGATPAGLFYARQLYYRPDRIKPEGCKLALLPLTQKTGWCDDPKCQDYNRPVTLPHASRCETLWREDHVYDLVLVISHNDQPAIQGKGSAIFIHIARDNYQATEGCVALAPDHFMEIIKRLTPETLIRIHTNPEG